jgi:glycosyltransferase involved in cell wall biosynthesis
MDENDQLLSHQVEVVKLISKSFNEVYVLTGKIGKVSLPDNVVIENYNWIKGKKFSNSFKLIFAFFKIKKNRNISVLFSHMTFSQSLVILPLTKIFRIRHFLWYAHKSPNTYLRLTHGLFDGILTSTRDSCPIKHGKIFPIGQTINSSKFKTKSKLNHPITKLIHIGRFDPIKNISEIINAVQKVRIDNPKLELEIVGSPTSTKSINYENDTKLEFIREVEQGWLRFAPGVPRSKVPELLFSSDAFIHACDAALDKVLLEANLSKLPVISINKEYLKTFGTWSNLNNLSEVKLEDELRVVLQLKNDELVKVVQNRFKLTLDHHELTGWTNRLVEVICS